MIKIGFVINFDYKSWYGGTNVIKNDRIRFEGFKNRKKVLELYNYADIALDTFPYGGMTTSLEAIYMGVPTLTVEGNSLLSRFTFEAEVEKVFPGKNTTASSQDFSIPFNVELNANGSKPSSLSNLNFSIYKSASS